MDTVEELVSKVESLENQIRALQVQLMMSSGEDGGFMGADEVCAAIPGEGDGYAECFDIKSIDEETGVVVLENCYYAIGGRTYNAGTGSGTTSEMSVTVEAGKTLCLKIGAGSSRSASLECIYGLPDSLTLDEDYYRIPLYMFDDNRAVKVDMRSMPMAAMIEFGNY